MSEPVANISKTSLINYKLGSEVEMAFRKTNVLEVFVVLQYEPKAFLSTTGNNIASTLANQSV